MPSTVARGTVLGFIGQAWQLATAFLLYHYLSKVLGPAGFGQWRVTLSVLNYFEILVTTGLIQVASRRIAEAPQDAPCIERGAYLAQMVLAAGLFLLLEVTAGLIATALKEPSLEPLIRIAAIDIPFVAACMLARNLQLGQHRFTRAVTGMLAYATAKFVAIIALVWLGFSVPGALIGNVISSIVGFAFMFAPWQKVTSSLKKTIGEARGMGLESVPFITQTLVAGVAADADLWFVQAARGSAAAGFYGGAAALAEIPSFLFTALSNVLFPSVARAKAEQDDAMIARYATQGVRLAVLVTVLGVAAIAASGGAVLAFVYTAAFAVAAVPFTVLMVASVGRNVRATCTDVMMARGHRRQALAIVISTTVAEVALLAYVVPAFGQLGAAVAAAVAAIAAGVAAVWALRALLHWRIAWTLVRSMIAAAVVWVGLVLANPKGFWLIPAFMLAGVVYAAVLRLLREIDADDLASLRRVVARAS